MKTPAQGGPLQSLPLLVSWLCVSQSRCQTTASLPESSNPDTDKRLGSKGTYDSRASHGGHRTVLTAPQSAITAHWAAAQPASSLECCTLANPILEWLFPNWGTGQKRRVWFPGRQKLMQWGQCRPWGGGEASGGPPQMLGGTQRAAKEIVHQSNGTWQVDGWAKTTILGSQPSVLNK